MAKLKKSPKKIILIVIFVIVVFTMLAVLAVFIFLYGCTSHRKAPNSTRSNSDLNNSVYDESTCDKGMYVDGCVLRNSDGTPFVMRGVNVAHCWYSQEDEVSFDAIADTGANCIRIVLANGIQWDADTEESLQSVIEAAGARNMVAIVEIHDGTGSDSIETLDAIADYWVSMAGVLQGTENYCIVNIANEWCGSWNGELWKNGYVNVIPKLRNSGIHNVIMVDSAGWGQYGRSIWQYGVEVFEADPEQNTMFSVHMYGMSGRYEWLIRYNLEGATDANLCVCVGEFGYTHSDGDVKEDYLMKYCEEKGIGTIAWSWKGNSGGVEYLDLSLDWEGKQLSSEWGEKVVYGEYGIKNTSVISSQFICE